MYLGSRRHKELISKLSYDLVENHYGDSFGVVQQHLKNMQKLNQALDIIGQLQNEIYPSLSSEAYKELKELLTSIKL